MVLYLNSKWGSDIKDCELNTNKGGGWMKFKIVEKSLVLTPEDDYDFFLLGQIAKTVKEYNYDYVGTDTRTIKLFRINLDNIIKTIVNITTVPQPRITNCNH